MTVSETLRLASEALQQASAALVATAQAMEDAPGPEPAPELEPGEWRNDRAPKGYETDDDGKLWIWCGDWPLTHPAEKVHWDTPTHFPNLRYWAPGNLPAPKSPPPSVVGSQRVEHDPAQSRTGGWIVDRLPTREDADADGQVMIPGARQDELSLATWTSFYFVHPGTPWCSPDCLPAPWDPTCLDRNGWIRSRLPTVEDAKGVGVVLIPVGHSGTASTVAYHVIVPGQPWAPWGSNPGGFEK